METALTTKEQASFTRDQLELLKRTIAKGTTDDEFQLFVMQSTRMGLDPFAHQIHAVKRKSYDRAAGGYVENMVIQVGIDGYRLVADRTGNYAPGREPSFAYKDDKLFSATAYVMKFVRGSWMEVAATAHYAEYVQTKQDGNPTSMWQKPHIMLSKCAEALALRRAFPAELSGIYTDEEMGQADNQPAHPVTIVPNGNGHKPAPVIVEPPAPEEPPDIIEGEVTPAPDSKKADEVSQALDLNKALHAEIIKKEWPKDAKLTYQMAASVLNRDGIRYIDIPAHNLKFMKEGLKKNTVNPKLSDAERDEAQLKLDVCEIVLSILK